MNGYYKIYFETCHLPYLSILKEINDKSEKALWYFHPGGKKNPDRPHIHGLVLNCTFTTDGLRRKIKKVFNLTSKTQYGLSNTYDKGTKMSELTVPGYMAYMTKGQFDPVGEPKGFSLLEVSIARTMFKPKEEVIEKRYELEIIHKVKKLTLWQCAFEAETRYMIENNDEVFDTRKLLWKVKEVLKENKILCHKVQVRNIIQDIQSRQDPERFDNDVLRFL